MATHLPFLYFLFIFLIYIFSLDLQLWLKEMLCSGFVQPFLRLLPQPTVLQSLISDLEDACFSWSWRRRRRANHFCVRLVVGVILSSWVSSNILAMDAGYRLQETIQITKGTRVFSLNPCLLLGVFFLSLVLFVYLYLLVSVSWITSYLVLYSNIPDWIIGFLFARWLLSGPTLCF